MKALAFLCILSICVSSVVGIAFTKNVSFSVTNEDWHYRETQVTVLPFLNICGFRSFSLGATKHSVQGDAMWGAMYATLETPPTSWIGFWSANYTANDKDDKYKDMEVASSSGFIALAFIALLEKDVNGKTVAGLDLAQRVLTPSPNWDITDSNDDGPIKWVTFTGTQISKPYTLKLTFVASDVVGVIDYSGATVSPKSLESILEINNWPYANKANTLSLVVATATGEATYSGNTLISGTGANKVYSSFSKTATINASPQGVQVSTFSDGDAQAIFGDGVVQQIDGKYKSAATAKLVTITFPAGAESIVYDPTIGSGDPVEAPSAASVVVAGWLLSVFVVIMALL